MPKEATVAVAKKTSNSMRHEPLDRQIKESKVKAEGNFSKADRRKVRPFTEIYVNEIHGLIVDCELVDEPNNYRLLQNVVQMTTTFLLRQSKIWN
jgi:hypothetical protein